MSSASEDLAGPRRSTPQPSAVAGSFPWEQFLAWRAPPVAVFATFIGLGTFIAFISWTLAPHWMEVTTKNFFNLVL